MVISINELPEELIVAIFERCLPQNSTFKSQHAPLALTRVCSLWRRAAWSTPSLWTHISLREDNLSSKGLIYILEMWLLRSKEKAIDVRLDVRWEDLTALNIRKSAPFYRRVARMLISHCARIRSLTGAYFASIISSFPFSKMRNLAELRLVGIEDSKIDDDFDTLSQLIDISSSLPNLRELSLVGLRLDVCSLQSQTQISKIDLDRLRPTEARALLAALSNLQYACFSLISEDRVADPASGRIQVPALRELHIICDPDILVPDASVNLRSVLKAFAASNLQSLSLECFSNSVDNWSALRDFVSSSRMHCLQTLSLSNATHPSDGLLVMHAIASDFLLGIIPAIHSVKHLSLRCISVDPCIMHAFCLDEADGQALPGLESLTIADCDGFSDADVLAVLRSSVGSTTLQEMYLINCSGLTCENARILHEAASGISKFGVEFSSGTIERLFEQEPRGHEHPSLGEESNFLP